MYHDQGHIPLKMAGFRYDPAAGRWASVAGVNITPGLPIIRTSVDHGTAFDLAWTGEANEQTLKAPPPPPSALPPQGRPPPGTPPRPSPQPPEPGAGPKAGQGPPGLSR